MLRQSRIPVRDPTKSLLLFETTVVYDILKVVLTFESLKESCYLEQYFITAVVTFIMLRSL